MSKSSKQRISIETKYDTIHFNDHPCELSSFSFIPPTRKDYIKKNLFNFHQQVGFANSSSIKDFEILRIKCSKRDSFFHLFVEMKL
jgi:hypothetical protein